MADIENKENFSPVRLELDAPPTKASPSPKKQKKGRSKSIGPGGLDGADEKHQSPKFDRRKVLLCWTIDK